MADIAPTCSEVERPFTKARDYKSTPERTQAHRASERGVGMADAMTIDSPFPTD